MSAGPHTRWKRRLLQHHLPAALGSALAISGCYALAPSPDLLTRASFATALPALLLIALTLMTGPGNVLLKRRNPVSSDLRRDLGIWAAILSLLHTVLGQNVHLRGRPWLYYVYGKNERHTFPLRHDLFGFSNETGALGTVAILVLLATSSDLALRRLGTRRWKQLQRWNYAAFGLAAAHTILYQWNESHIFGWKLLVAGALAAAASLQIAGFFRRRHYPMTPGVRGQGT